MPQMSPTLWLTMFIMFIMSLTYISTMIYFSKKIKPINNKIKTKINKMNWTW